MLNRPCSSGVPALDVLAAVSTPAIVYDQLRLETLVKGGLAIRSEADVKLLYAVKASAQPEVLEYFAPRLDGFAVSSLFEARYVRERYPSVLTHFTSPGIKPAEASDLFALCDYVAANSRTQLLRYGGMISERSSLGIRVNTKVSNVLDKRYDPCRPNSKLGIPLEEVPELIHSAPVAIEGVHFHTNSDSTDYNELLSNVYALVDAIPQQHELRWVNLGGGYLLEDASPDPLVEASKILRSRLGVELFMEPGAGLVRSAGFLIGSVLDLFRVDDTDIAVLDTAVNHMPEVLEFDYQPEVVGQMEEGPFEYVLAGATCLAGDVFGTYRFLVPLEVGSKVVFTEAGAYSLVKAHRFNGTNLPEVGFLTSTGCYRIAKTFTYSDFASFWRPNV